MTDKEIKKKILAKIERLKLCTMDEHMKFYSEAAEGEYNAFQKVLEIINSLPEESASKDLEEAATEYAHDVTEIDGNLRDYGIDEDEYNAFKAGAEWQRKDVIEKACKWLKENATYIHPRKGTKECMINLTVFKEAMEE